MLLCHNQRFCGVEIRAERIKPQPLSTLAIGPLWHPASGHHVTVTVNEGFWLRRFAFCFCKIDLRSAARSVTAGATPRFSEPTGPPLPLAGFAFGALTP